MRSASPPAVNIYSAADNGGYLTGEGTSYAAPYVAAAAALLWSAHPNATAGQVIHQLVTTATQVGTQPHDDRYGYGMVNPLGALTTPLTRDTTNPLSQPPTATTPDSGIPSWLIIVIVVLALALAAAVVTAFVRRRVRQRAAIAAVSAKPPTPTKHPTPSGRARRPTSQRRPRAKK